MSKEDSVRDALDDAVQEIVQAQSNPRTWLSWMTYFLARLDEQANLTGPTNKESYLDMLAALQDEIRSRARTGGWN